MVGGRVETGVSTRVERGSRESKGERRAHQRGWLRGALHSRIISAYARKPSLPSKFCIPISRYDPSLEDRGPPRHAAAGELAKSSRIGEWPEREWLASPRVP